MNEVFQRSAGKRVKMNPVLFPSVAYQEQGKIPGLAHFTPPLPTLSPLHCNPLFLVALGSGKLCHVHRWLLYIGTSSTCCYC